MPKATVGQVFTAPQAYIRIDNQIAGFVTCNGRKLFSVQTYRDWEALSYRKFLLLDTSVHLPLISISLT